MMSEHLRWTARTTLMFFAGVIPAILLFLVILIVMPLAGIISEMVIAGLWTATFRDEHERILPNGVTIVLVLCGLLGALPPLIDMAPDAIADGGLSLLLTVGLLGPVI